VLHGAAIGALIATPIWILAICAPPQVVIVVRLLAVVAALVVSAIAFVTGSWEAAVAMAPQPSIRPDPRRRFIEMFEEYEREERGWGELPTRRAAERINGSRPGRKRKTPELLEPLDAPESREVLAPPVVEPVDERSERRRRRREEADEVPTQADSSLEALLWLTSRQAAVPLCLIGVACIILGCFMPAAGQVLWPIATLLLGVACGTAAFAPEQRDLSYEFLAAQHLPMPSIWRFRVLYWFAAAVLGTLLMALAWFVIVILKAFARPLGAGAGAEEFQAGTLHALLGPVLFFCIWILYGFSAGAVFVWLCRKTLMALLLSAVIAIISVSVWLPSLLCRGMGGWQLWLAPLLLLGAGHMLVRAWAGGRIKERRPLLVLIGVGGVALLWALMNFGYRAWALPDVGAPLDRKEFRAQLTDGGAGQKIQQAIGELEEPEEKWLKKMEEATQMPVGVLETPLGEGQTPILRHLPGCEKMGEKLRELASNKQAAQKPAAGFEHLNQILALSRNLRNKAPVKSYLLGIKLEASALDGLDDWLERGKPTPELLQNVLEYLSHHARETPPAVDCVQTECFRAGGVIANPALWSLRPTNVKGDGARIPERWLSGGVTLAFEAPWEAERKDRLWQIVWAGLIRSVETPYWERPFKLADPPAATQSTKNVLLDWLPATEGPGSSLTIEQVARWLDASWLSEPRLFAPVGQLRAAATRSRWRVAAYRQAIALALYEMREKKPAEKLDDLVPKYLDSLPVDPYSGQPFHYRISQGERLIGGMGDEAGGAIVQVHRGQGVLWSTGPDRVDHGGLRNGAALDENDTQWKNAGLDLITLVPRWAPHGQ
jgi:hypothetical protein